MVFKKNYIFTIWAPKWNYRSQKIKTVPIKYLIKKIILQFIFTGNMWFLQWTTKLSQFNLQSLLNTGPETSK